MEERRNLTMILGHVGTGKSKLARVLHSNYLWRITIDPRAEHKGEHICESLVDFFDLARGGGQVRTGIVVRDIQDVDDYRDVLFDYLQACRGFCVFVDEVDKYADPKKKGGVVPGLLELANYRRHLGIDLIFVARRAARVDRDLTALADTVHLFHTHEALDLKYMRDNFGKDVAARLPRLLRDQYITVEWPDPIRTGENRKSTPTNR